MDYCSDDHFGTCSGEISLYESLSGSGERYPRCEKHYKMYAARVGPEIRFIRERYPYHAPADFDPYYAGEMWDDDY